MNAQTLADLYRHMEWADAAVWTATLACPAATMDAKLRGTLDHVHHVQRAFLRIWRGEPRHTPYPTFEEASALMTWARSYYGEAHAHLQGLTDEDLAQVLPVPWASMVEAILGRAPAPTTVGETVLQVTLHSLHHRGQATARLREVGGAPPLVDYIAWVWFGRPSAQWPAVSAGDAPQG
jgi:uncharacterized damage-inducible protein DinB